MSIPSIGVTKQIKSGENEERERQRERRQLQQLKTTYIQCAGLKRSTYKHFQFPRIDSSATNC